MPTASRPTKRRTGSGRWPASMATMFEPTKNGTRNQLAFSKLCLHLVERGLGMPMARRNQRRARGPNDRPRP